MLPYWEVEDHEINPMLTTEEITCNIILRDIN